MENTRDTLESNFEQVELLLQKMEQEDTSLEESFKLYDEGMKLIKKCNDKIDKIEKDIILIEKGEDNHEL